MPTIPAEPRARPRRDPTASWTPAVRLTVSMVLAICALLAATSHPAPDARAAAAHGPAGEFTLAARQVTIDGLRIEGVGPAPGDPRQRQTLRLSATQALARQLLLQAPLPAARFTVTCPADCLIAGRPARLYVLELTATPIVAGIPTVPITLTPARPVPPPAVLGILQLPRLTFRDFRARLTLVTGDVLRTPAVRATVLP